MNPRTIKQLAAEAISIQNACNLRGLLNSFAGNERQYNVIKELHECSIAWRDIVEHPVTKLWIDKLASLANVQGTFYPDENETDNRLPGYAIENPFQYMERILMSLRAYLNNLESMTGSIGTAELNTSPLTQAHIKQLMHVCNAYSLSSISAAWDACEKLASSPD